MSAELADAGLAISDLLTHHFIVNALLAGIPIAALAGLVGYFLVLRSQVFTGDALSHVAFTGAACALALGIDLRLGLLVATVGVAAALGLLGRTGRPDDVVTGTVFAWILGIGALALSVYSASPRATNDATAGVSVLFGSIFGLSTSAALVAAAVSLALFGATVLTARPLLFASIDHDVARARRVPTRALGVGFLIIVGASTAEATQAIGALLILGLLAAPAGAAAGLTDRPYTAMALSVAVATTSMICGLLLAYVIPQLPPSTAIVALASLVLAASRLRSPVSRLRRINS